MREDDRVKHFCFRLLRLSMERSERVNISVSSHSVAYSLR